LAAPAVTTDVGATDDVTGMMTVVAGAGGAVEKMVLGTETTTVW